MANDTTNRPWIIDTAAATVISSDRLRVSRMDWVGATTAGHQLVVKDAAGRVVWESFANGANFLDRQFFGAEREGSGIDIEGLIVSTLGSGKLYISLL